MPAYTEAPYNYSAIEPFVRSDGKGARDVFHSAERVIFYDTCSFQRHARLPEKERHILAGYFRKQGASLFITGCVLMELASERRLLSPEYISFIREMHGFGVHVVIFREECMYDMLAECFASGEEVNAYLTWAVRTVRSPAGTIAETLALDEKLGAEIMAGRNAGRHDLYQRFFTAVRHHKEPGDDLGEELIAVCVHILSRLPGVPDGKICVITDDKGAAGRISAAVRRPDPRIRAAGIILFSTPKLLQHMFQDGAEMTEEEMADILSQGISGNVTVMGITPYDFAVREKISMSVQEMVSCIREPNAIRIVF